MLLNLPGIYPPEVLLGLRRLERANLIPEFDVLSVELEAASKPFCNGHPVAVHDRRIEHPLDFEWLFTREGSARICHEIRKFIRKDAVEVLCLGCPSVYRFGRRNMKNWDFRLWDKNVLHLGQVEEAEEVFCVDLCDGPYGDKPADVVVIDPPWYNPYYFLFLWAATHCLNKGGRIVLSFPPEGTRPNVKEERRELFIWCKRNGFIVEKRTPNILKYRSPLFEVNALRAQGVTNFPLDWRRGDLLVLKKMSAGVPPKPEVSMPRENWQEVRLGHVRVKVCCTRPCGRNLLVSAGKAPVLPSVSSRHPARKLANVVTSGNRFLLTKSPDDLIACLNSLKMNGTKTMVEDFIVSKNPLLWRKALNLILREETEVANYFRRINEI